MLHSVDGRHRSPHTASPPGSRVAGSPRRRRTRAHLPVAGTVLAVAVAVAGFVWLSTHATVTLVVDGVVSTHETHAPTVADFLERAGVAVGEGDEVVPAPDSPVRSGMQIEVVHAREVTLLVGDTERQVVASVLTVDDLLETLGGPALEGDAGPRRLVHPSRLSRVRSGMVVELSDPVALTVTADGHEQEVVTTDRTVADLLERLGIEVGPDDRVSPPLDTPVEHGMAVAVERVTVTRAVREESVAFRTVERETAELPEGERREAQAGSAGVRQITEDVTVVDGREIARAVVGDQLVREPVERVVEVGTAPPPPTPAAPDAGEVAAAQAEPEPQVHVQETEQAAPDDAEPQEEDGATRVETGAASWYDNPYGGFTAAHRTAPRGTIVRVTNVANGRSIDVRVNDRGPFVEGRVIDLNRAAFAELAAPSRGIIQVRIEW